MKFDDHVRRKDEERLPPKNLGMVSTWKKKKRKTSKFVDAGSINWNEREGTNNMEWNNREEWRRKIKL